MKFSADFYRLGGIYNVPLRPDRDTDAGTIELRRDKMKQILAALAITAVLLASPALASQKLTNGDKIQLQAAMQKSISRQLVDGQYLYFDAGKDTVVTLYPVQAHPMILQMGPHFILCSDFRNEAGKDVNIDFYITRRNSSFVIFDTKIDQRQTIQRMMKAGAVSPLK